MRYRTSLPVKMWAAEDRPDYKLDNDGLRSMTTSELLSVIIGTGTDVMNQVEIARKLLADNDNSLQRISRMTVSELNKVDGIGAATARKILASLEIGRRMIQEKNGDRPQLNTAMRIHNIMLPVIGALDIEEFWVLYLNQNFRLIKKVRISHGGITETSADVRIIIREAVLCNATVIVACHNHPSGSLTPSKEDDVLTSGIKKACDVMRIRFTDHLIVTEGGYYSYHEQGKL